ncbi:fructosamine kinase family protein [Piscibacillus halophilus]|uniref:Fructosamine-3-kinase n=1 Tax=Piscibacillus halophilus TaxID=571933 RepID=A0A1H9C1M5_9BACI|nr:fructosamine kinase family protein [Piscibacillus halophilus]SEP94871.1 Fructosamine-3-kinase [Piscibacillus halophilus]
MKETIQEALNEAEDKTNIKTIKPVSGGSINESFYVETDRHRYFIKYHPNAPDHFFYLEKEGLEKIRETNSIRVPEVYAFSNEKQKAYLVLEWIEGETKPHTSSQLGRDIARMHHSQAAKHGLDHSTFIGTLLQPNQLYNEWVDYYKECRLINQLNKGKENGHISGNRQQKLETLIEQLDQYIPKGIEPTYLHGDLWGGNWLAGSDGSPYVIDPSFLYGDRHFDLAFTELFGGFSEEFYRAYQVENPIEPYYKDVKDLYQLYYLLVHLNIFGEVYGGSVDRILYKYIG